RVVAGGVELFDHSARGVGDEVLIDSVDDGEGRAARWWAVEGGRWAEAGGTFRGRERDHDARVGRPLDAGATDVGGELVNILTFVAAEERDRDLRRNAEERAKVGNVPSVQDLVRGDAAEDALAAGIGDLDRVARARRRDEVGVEAIFDRQMGLHRRV